VGAQQRRQLRRRAHPHAREAALLELDPRAGEVVDDLGEVRLVADDQDPRVGVVAEQQLAGVVAVEVAGEGTLLERLDVERLERQPRGVPRADLRARVADVHPRAEARERPAGQPRLLLAPRRQHPLGVRGRVVRHGLAVSQQPESLRHAADDIRHL
jgi:hypothetical protein